MPGLIIPLAIAFVLLGIVVYRWEPAINNPLVQLHKMGEQQKKIVEIVNQRCELVNNLIQLTQGSIERKWFSSNKELSGKNHDSAAELKEALGKLISSVSTEDIQDIKKQSDELDIQLKGYYGLLEAYSVSENEYRYSVLWGKLKANQHMLQEELKKYDEISQKYNAVLSNP